jgi:site-specific DNA-adenine methylase
MNDLDKKDLLELAQIIKSTANNSRTLLDPFFGSVSNNNTISRVYSYYLDDIEEIMGCVDAKIVENKPHLIERMF